MLLALVEEQIKLGLQPVIASIGEKGIEPKPLEVAARQKGFTVEVFQMLPGPNIAGAMKILRYAWRNHFDIIHSHGYKSNVLFGFLPRKLQEVADGDHTSRIHQRHRFHKESGLRVAGLNRFEVHR